jgi:spore coat protein U-like protein
MTHPSPKPPERKVWSPPSALLLLLATAGPALAGSCTVSSTGLAFGAYQPLTFAGKLTSSDRTSNASISVVCTGITSGGSYSIALGPSTTGSGDSISTRYLSNSLGGDNMVFNIYTNASYSTVWGNGTMGSLIGGSIPVGDSNQSQPVYGKIPAGQNTLRAGSFSDSLTMTLTYNP